MTGILVTDGAERSALAAVRSLGLAGYKVYVCSARTRCLAGASRFSAGEATVADPLATPRDFVQQVKGLIARWHIDVLLPISEASLLALLPEREQLGGVHLPFPAYEDFKRMCDKHSVLQVARDVGIAVPPQHVLQSPTDNVGSDPSALSFPVYVKPSRSVVDLETTRAKLGVCLAKDLRSLQTTLARLPSVAYPILLQRRIVGPGTGVFLLRWDGTVRASFAHRRLREKPPAGGVSVLRESVAAEPDLIERCRALLERFRWQGVAMLEFKHEVATGTDYLMEVNGRFWGSLQLAIDSGVDFPAILVRSCLGEEAREALDHRVGVRTRWEWGDVDHLLARLKNSREALDLPPDSPGRWHAVVEFLKGWGPGIRGEILRLRDPRPFLRETIDWARDWKSST